MIKACIFDLDGTLTDTLESLKYSVNTVLKELELGQVNDEQCKAFLGNGARYFVERSLEAAGDPQLRYAEAGMEAYKRIFKENCTYKVAPYEGIVEMLTWLKEQGIRLAVLSNKPHVQTKDVVATFFQEGTFDFVQGQQDDIPRKPDPAAVFAIISNFGIAKEECLYVGDSDVDMNTGINAGVTTVGVTWGFRTKEVLIENGAHYTIDKPDELISIVKEA